MNYTDLKDHKIFDHNDTEDSFENIIYSFQSYLLFLK